MKHNLKHIINEINALNILGQQIDTSIYRQTYVSKDKNFTTREIFTEDGEVLTDLSEGIYSFGKLVKYNDAFFNCFNVIGKLVVTNRANVVDLTVKAKTQIDYNYNSCDIALDKNLPSVRIYQSNGSKFSSLVEFAEFYSMYNAISTSRNRYTRECFVIDVDYDCEKIKPRIDSILCELNKRGLTPSCMQKHLTNNHIQFFWFFDKPKHFKNFKNNNIYEMINTLKLLQDGLYEYYDFALLTKGDEELSESGEDYKNTYIKLGSLFQELFDKNFKGWKMKNPFFNSPDFSTTFFNYNMGIINPNSYKDVITYSFDDIKLKLSDIILVNSDKNKHKNILVTNNEDFITSDLSDRTDLGRNDIVLIESRKVCHKNLLMFLKTNNLNSQTQLSFDDINKLREKSCSEVLSKLFNTLNTSVFKGTKNKNQYTKKEFISTFNCSFDYVFNNFDILKLGSAPFNLNDTKKAARERQNENTIKFIKAFKYLTGFKRKKKLNKKERLEIIHKVVELTNLKQTQVSYFIKNKFLKLSNTEFQKMFVSAINDYNKRKNQLKNANKINEIWCYNSYEHQQSDRVNSIYQRCLNNKNKKQERFNRIASDDHLISSISINVNDNYNYVQASEALFAIDYTLTLDKPPDENFVQN